MRYEELNDTTRAAMLAAFEAEEESGQPYRSRVLTSAGKSAFPGLMRDAIAQGTEVTLATALDQADYWTATDARGYTSEATAAARRLALTEFNTWYVAGLARVLLDEGETDCEVYRAEDPGGVPALCSAHEEVQYPLALVVEGHRIAYWPPPGLRHAFTIPAGPNCHHTIRRISKPD